MDGWKSFLGKKVYVELNSGRRYTGIINEIDERGAIIFISMIDRFGKKVCFVSSELKIIQEEC